MPPLLQRRRASLSLLALLAVVAAVHGAVIVLAPDPVLFGDEGDYLAHAYEDAERGDLGLLPGQLRFDWRPELASRIYAQFAGRYVEAADVVRAASRVQLAMLLALLALVYTQARLLALSRGASLLACGLLAVFPWFGFYVHALWPEIPHAFLLGAALCCVQAHLVSGRWPWLVPAGVALGYALFAKGSINLFVPVLAAALAVAAWRRGAASGATGARRWAPTLAAPLVLLASLSLTLAPQLVRNAHRGHGLRLASNRWVNLELGLVQPSDRKDIERGEIYARYEAGGGTPAEKEERSRRRTLAHLESLSAVQLLAQQSAKLARLVGHQRSFFEIATQRLHRWGDEPRGWLDAAAPLGRGLWYAIVALGIAGAAVLGWRSAGWAVLALLLLYFAAALLAVPLKPRFAMPVVPVLCLFTAGFGEWALRLLRRRPGPPAGPAGGSRAESAPG